MFMDITKYTIPLIAAEWSFGGNLCKMWINFKEFYTWILIPSKGLDNLRKRIIILQENN